VLCASVLAFYGPALTRPFTSEDYLLIRFLAENPPWRDLRSLFIAPWLGISVVKFYRPVATLLYGIEIAAFGGRPFGYNTVHLLVHLANTTLLWAIVRRLCQGFTPFAAALLFALYPLHPNAILFGASFATLFGAGFFLAALLAYQQFRGDGSAARWIASLAFFVLALGSYEAAVVLPVLLAAYDHLVAARAKAAPGYLPFFGVLGLYFLLRKWIFGVFVGGYAEAGQRLLAPNLRQMAGDLTTSIYQLHLPVYDRTPGPWEAAVICALLFGAPLAFRLLRGGSHARLWLFGWVWILLAQAPFAFRPSVPANGRYWYLAAAGVAMSVAFLARWLFAVTRPPWRGLAPAAVGLLAVAWSLLLAGYVGATVEAGRTARRVQTAILRAGRASAEMFVTRHPDFVLNSSRVPIAQVLRYGLWDSVHPPFVTQSIPLYPLPPLAGAELLPVALGEPASPIYEWEEGSLRRFVPPSAISLPEFRVLRPAPDAGVEPGRDHTEVAVPPGDHARFRLIVVSRINGAVFDLDAGALRGGVLRADLPQEMLATSDHLYGRSAHYWWIEARNAGGAVSGFSRMRRFHLAD